MDIDLIVKPVMDVMEKMARDGGEALMKAGGARAAAAGKALFDRVMGLLKKEDPKTAERFPKNPEGYKTPASDTLKEAVEAEPSLADELKKLLAEYQSAAEKAGVAQTATVIGDGAVAQGNGATAAGAGGMAVGGNVGGNISVGSGTGNEK